MNGVLALWKEKGMTSHDCVFKLRKIYQTKKIGHTGTLDPNVDGVLPICIGSATKLVEFLINSNKTYIGEITLGFATTTEDLDGEVIARQNILKDQVNEQQIDDAMKKMIGQMIQIPPMYSAVKVNGKKLYEYARSGQTVERPKRSVTIVEFVRTSPVVYNAVEKTMTFAFKVECSKGTYIRTLATDLGNMLNVPSCMTRLTRIQSAKLTREHCVTLQQLESLSLQERVDKLVAIENVTLDYDQYEIDEMTYHKVKNGSRLKKIENISYPIFFTYQHKIIALYEEHPDKINVIKPKKMLLSNGKN